jgi:RNA polymerase sigma factor (sigma-70 family)
VNLSTSQTDTRLLPFLLATDEQEEELILSRLISEHVEPIIRQVLRSKLQFYLDGRTRKTWSPDVEEVFNEVQLHLLKRLRELKEDSAAGSVGNLHSYVATVARHTCDEYLRRKYPRRRQLKDKVRYYLNTHGEFALWESGDHVWLCGLAGWQHDGKLLRGTLALHWTTELQGLVQTRLQDTDARRLKLDALLTYIFHALGEPVELDCMTAIVAGLWGVEDHPEESFEDDDKGFLAGSLASAQVSPDTIFEYHQLLQQLWGEILQLPRRQRVALLLNLRNPQRINVITLLPATSIATFEQIAEALEIPLEQFEKLWANLPMDDLGIAELLGATRQQVINLRKNARDRLTRRLKALEKKRP